jgi:hypothetical protein
MILSFLSVSSVLSVVQEVAVKLLGKVESTLPGQADNAVGLGPCW